MAVAKDAVHNSILLANHPKKLGEYLRATPHHFNRIYRTNQNDVDLCRTRINRKKLSPPFNLHRRPDILLPAHKRA